ncbi:MAG: ubiquinol-cytochrome C chaperone family protein [Alphaproteobacteria bacterium]|nr:ubiquinol-cytochrome C chaperone family protein [Alphaproteobacteria bacterium]
MSLAALFHRKYRNTVQALYGAIVAASRARIFYEDWGVPDTLDGRFELIALHTFLAMRRLKQSGDSAAFSQALFDTMFGDLDRNLREMGVGDLSVGRQVKTMAKAFYGRIRAYERGLAGTESLDEALRRNLYGTVAPSAAQIAAAAAYLRRQAQVLDAAPVGRLLSGELPLAAED